MAKYFVNRDGQESGPHGLHDLVALIREGHLADSDLVRFSWTNEWQRADSIVGLFHMANRATAAPVPVDEPAATAADIKPIAVEPTNDVMLSEADDRPGWMLRLLHVGGLRRKNRSEIQILGPKAEAVDAPGSGTAGVSPSVAPTLRATGASPELLNADAADTRAPIQQLAPELAQFANGGASEVANIWSDTIEEAKASVETRRGGKRRRDKSRSVRGAVHWLEKLVPDGERRQSLMRSGFRIVCALVVSNLVAFAVDGWSARQALRFPTRDVKASGMHNFPWIGSCSEAEYLFLMFDLMLVTGAAAWFAARWAESRAE